MSQPAVRLKGLKHNMIPEALGKKAAKMEHTAEHTALSVLIKDEQQPEGASQGSVSSDPQDELLAKFNTLLTKALKATSQKITENLLKKIREVAKRTAELKAHVEDISIHIESHTKKIWYYMLK